MVGGWEGLVFGERDVLGKRRRLSAGGKLGLGVHSFRSKLFLATKDKWKEKFVSETEVEEEGEKEEVVGVVVSSK